jgi:hypothetical protein
MPECMHVLRASCARRRGGEGGTEATADGGCTTSPTHSVKQYARQQNMRFKIVLAKSFEKTGGLVRRRAKSTAGPVHRTVLSNHISRPFGDKETFSRSLIFLFFEKCSFLFIEQIVKGLNQTDRDRRF